MTLLVPMYHRARAERHGNAPEVLDAHFAAIAERAHVVVPGQPCRPDRLSVCLTFDDAYFDFRAIVVPLLQKHGLRAVLAVPAGCILDGTSRSSPERLNLATEDAFRPGNGHGFCTWPELFEIAQTDCVAFAAHGFHHVRLDDPAANLEEEIDRPAEVLQRRLGCEVTSFVFPYGRYNRQSLARATARYRHVFRIGGASNDGWRRQPLYRVTADNLVSPTDLVASSRLLRFRARRVWNRLRGR